jgi:hypothetical protein
MTTQSAVSRFDQRSLIGIGASLGAAVAVGLLCKWVGVPDPVTGTLTAGAASLPAAVAYSLQGRRRNVTDEISRIRQGELRRPVGLVMVMLVAALFLAELISPPIEMRTSLRGEPGEVLTALITAALAFFISWYASHYLGKHPYRWTVVAVGALFIIDTVIYIALSAGAPWYWQDFLFFLSSIIVRYSMVLNASLAGAWYGRRHYDKFLAKKLARLERKAAKEAAKGPESTLQSHP